MILGRVLRYQSQSNQNNEMISVGLDVFMIQQRNTGDNSGLAPEMNNAAEEEKENEQKRKEEGCWESDYKSRVESVDPSFIRQLSFPSAPHAVPIKRVRNSSSSDLPSLPFALERCDEQVVQAILSALFRTFSLSENNGTEGGKS